MPASSLSRLARRACERNLQMISDVGDAPYEIVKPLLKLMDPLQLHELELASPQVIGRDEEVWKMFIKRDIMHSDKMEISPDDPSEWYSIYKALLDAQEERLANADAALRNIRFNAETEKNKHAAKRVELSTVKPLPGTTTSNEIIRMTKTERRHLRDPVRGRFSHPESRVKGTSKGAAEATSKPKSKLTKIRKAAVQMNKVFNSSANRAPAAVAQRQITRAPASFIEQHRQASPQSSKPAAQVSPAIVSRKRGVDQLAADDREDDFVTQRKRMKAATNQSPSKQKISSLADISKSINTVPASYKPDTTNPETKTKAKSPNISPPPPSFNKATSKQPLPIPRLDHGPGPMKPQKKAPVGIFMAARKRVT